jgi:membrane protease YdiL (CAAX protease family)
MVVSMPERGANMPGKAVYLDKLNAAAISGGENIPGDSDVGHLQMGEEAALPLTRGQAIKSGLLLSGFIATMSVSQYIFAYKNVAYGIIACLALVFAIYVYLVFRPVEIRLADTMESLALLPLYVLFSSSLPWFFINQNYLLPAVYSSIIALCLYHVYQKNIDLREIIGPLPEKRVLLGYIMLGIVIGSYTGMVEYIILRPEPFFPHFSVKYLLQNTVYMVFFVALGEELLFRALIQRSLTRLYNWKWGLLGTSLLFSIMHLTWRSVPELFFVFVAGLIFGGLYIKTKSLYLPIIVHGINNTMLVAVYPFILKNLS